MEDYGEYVPPDAVAANGMTGAEMHNYYPLLYHRAGYRYARSKPRPIVSSSARAGRVSTRTRESCGAETPRRTGDSTDSPPR